MRGVSVGIFAHMPRVVGGNKTQRGDVKLGASMLVIPIRLGSEVHRLLLPVRPTERSINDESAEKDCTRSVHPW